MKIGTQNFIIKIFKILAIPSVLFSLLIIFTYSAIFWLNQHPSILEKKVKQAFSYPVNLKGIKVDWWWFGPRIHIKELKIFDKEKENIIFQSDNLVMKVKVLKSLRYHFFFFSTIILQKADLFIHLNNKRSEDAITVDAIDNIKNSSFFSKINYYLEDVDLFFKQLNISFNSIKKPPPVSLENFYIKLTKKRGRLSVAVKGELPQKKEKSRFKAMLSVNKNFLVEPINSATGEAYVDIKDLDISSIYQPILNKYSKYFIFKNGKLSLENWFYFDKGVLNRVNGSFRFNDMTIAYNQENRESKISSFYGNFYGKRNKDFFQILAGNLKLNINQEECPLNRFNFKYYFNHSPSLRAKKNRLKWSIYFSKLNLSQLFPLFTLFPQIDDKTFSFLKSINIKGRLVNINLDKIYQSRAAFPYSFTFNFDHLSWAPSDNLFGLDNLSGSLKIDPDDNHLFLYSDKTTLTWPLFLKQPLTPINLNVDLESFLMPNKKWKLKLNLVDLKSQIFSIASKGEIDFINKKNFLVNLSSNFKIKEIAKLRESLSQKLITQSFIKWFNHSFPKGEIKTGYLNWRGYFKDLVYDQERSNLTSKIYFRDFQFHYRQDWPEFYKLNGQMNFEENKLNLSINSLESMNLKFHDVKVSLLDFDKKVLSIDGTSTVDLQDGFDFLRKTPLSFVKKFSPFELSGPAILKLLIKVPLSQNKENIHTKVLGNLSLNGSTFALKNGYLDLDDLTGKINFTEKEVDFGKIFGKYQDQPFTLLLNKIIDGENFEKLTGKVFGQVDLKSLSKQLNFPGSDYLSGITNYTAFLEINELNKAINFNGDSDLFGAKIEIPEIYEKPVNKIIPFSWRVKFKPGGSGIDFFSNYDENLKTALSFSGIDDHFKFLGGEIHLGPGEAKIPKKKGLILDFQIPHLNWKAWQKIVQRFYINKEGKSSALLRLVHLNIFSLDIFSMIFNQVDLKVVPSTSYFDFIIHTPLIEGNLKIPHHLGFLPIEANFEKLNIPKKKLSKNKLDLFKIPVKYLSSLNLDVKDFHFDRYDFNVLKLKTYPIESGFAIKQLNAQSDLAFLDITGNLLTKDLQKRLYLTGSLFFDNMGNLLDQLNFSHSFEDGYGTLSFDLVFDGPRENRSRGKRRGNLSLAVLNGRITHLNKQTQSAIHAGKFINFFNLEYLPKTLFHVSDWGKEGFNFNEIKGNFYLSDNEISTDDTYIKSDIADIKTYGKIDIVSQIYDMDLSIEPHLTSSLPLIIGIIGTPIAGGVTWFADKLFGPVISKRAASLYRISGTFDQPKVEKIN